MNTTQFEARVRAVVDITAAERNGLNLDDWQAVREWARVTMRHDLYALSETDYRFVVAALRTPPGNVTRTVTGE